jgi:hypothetical protein
VSALSTVICGETYAGRPVFGSFAAFIEKLCAQGRIAEAKRYLEGEQKCPAVTGKQNYRIEDDMTLLPLEGLELCPAGEVKLRADGRYEVAA